MKAPLQIETARLLLSRPERSDAEAIFERYANDRDVTRFLGWPRHRSIADTRAFLMFSGQEWEQWPAGPYLIWSRGNGQLLGGTGFGFETPDQAVTGYVLAKDAWGNGYATEALTAIVQVARDLGMRRLSALCHPEHRASRRVLEKCGFVRDGTWSRQVEFPNLAPGVPQDVACYEMLFAARGSTPANQGQRSECLHTRERDMELGAFSISLAVKDLEASRQFYEKFGFKVFAGDASQNWLILKNGDHAIGLFQGMFEKNILTFNPGWDSNAQKLARFTDIRELQRQLRAQGVELQQQADESTAGPASFVAVDPDGNPILVDQHV